MFFGCSAMTWDAGGVHLLGRTVDRAGESAEHSIVGVGRGVKCPRRLTLTGKEQEHSASGCLAYVGLTIDVRKFVPNAELLWVDGINERGLMMALLNFPSDRDNGHALHRADFVHFARIIPHILSRCETVEMAASVLERTTADGSELDMRAHFLLSDGEGESVVAEPFADADGNSFKIYRHTDGVLTNAPELPRQMEYWRRFKENPTMLPAAFSSTARFLRLMQIKSRAEKPKTEEEAVSKMFENLAPVTVPDGLDERKQYRTMFTSIMSAEGRAYYLNSAEDHRVKAVRVNDLKDGEIRKWSVDGKEDVDWL